MEKNIGLVQRQLRPQYRKDKLVRLIFLVYLLNI